MRNSHRNRAFSLLEVVFAAALMGLLMIVMGASMRQTQTVFRATSGSYDASAQLRKVTSRIQQELIQTNLNKVAVSNSVGAPPEGGAIWFLDNLDPATHEPRYLPDGSPFWARNILYYLVVPNNHASIFGSSCVLQAGPGPGGHDDRCPHKVLIRKEIDTGAAFNPTDDLTIEALIAGGAISTYFTRPNGYNVSAMLTEAGVREVKIVGQNLLSFEAQIQDGGIDLNIRAVSLARARREVAVGATSLYNSRYTLHFAQTVYPQAK